MKDNTTTNVQFENGSPAFAKPVLAAVPFSEVYLEDCTEALKRFNDKHFDLAIVDPPYGNVAVFENCQPLESKNERPKKLS